MKNEEYYSAVEFKKQKEYKPFLAEEYRKPLEIGAKAQRRRQVPSAKRFA